MSTIKVNAITDTSGGSNVNVPNAAKAWVNFNGTGTVAIRASYNVSSITDNSTGNYTVNFTTALADANYSCVGVNTYPANRNQSITVNPYTYATGSVRVVSAVSSTLYDSDIVNIAVFR